MAGAGTPEVLSAWKGPRRTFEEVQPRWTREIATKCSALWKPQRWAITATGSAPWWNTLGCAKRDALPQLGRDILDCAHLNQHHAISHEHLLEVTKAEALVPLR